MIHQFKIQSWNVELILTCFCGFNKGYVTKAVNSTSSRLINHNTNGLESCSKHLKKLLRSFIILKLSRQSDEDRVKSLSAANKYFEVGTYN